MGKWGTGKIIKVCLCCNNEFYSRQDREGKYCNRSCKAKLQKRTNTQIEIKCSVCAKDVKVKKYRSNTVLYCSPECRRKRMPSGNNHHNWKHGLARTFSSKKIINQLKKIHKKCQECDSSNDLQGHHVFSYSENKHLREDKNNIVILCKICHSKKHPTLESFILKGEPRKKGKKQSNL